MGDIVEGAGIDGVSPGEVVFVLNGLKIWKSVLHPRVERVGRVPATREPGEQE